MRRPLRTLASILVLVLVAGPTAAFGQPSAASPPSEAHGADLPDAEHDHEHAEDHAEEPADEGDHDHEPGVAGTRLLVAEADGATLLVIDLASGAELARFGTPGPGSVYQLPNPQLAVVVHRGDHRITFVHSGLTEVDHGDHADLVEGLPYVLQTLNVGPLPTHFFALGDDLAFFNDGDGTVAWLDRRLLGVSLEYVALDGRGPDHGAVAVLDDHAFVGYPTLALVDVVDRSGATVATFEGCPGLDGQAPWPSGVAFGCGDGVLLVEARPDGTFAAHKVPNPAGSTEGARVGTLVGPAHGGGGEGATALIGNFGQGIALIDPTARSLSAVALPAAPLATRFAGGGEVAIVLTADGVLHALDPASGGVLRSVAAVAAFEAGPRPTMTVLGAHVYVTDPRSAEVVEVHVDDFEVERRLPLPFVPGGLAGLAVPAAVAH